jgi:hypothetical protein
MLQTETQINRTYKAEKTFDLDFGQDINATQRDYIDILTALDRKDYDQAEALAYILTTTEEALQDLSLEQIEFLDQVTDGLSRPTRWYAPTDIDPRIPSVTDSIAMSKAYIPTGDQKTDYTAMKLRWGLDYEILNADGSPIPFGDFNTLSQEKLLELPKTVMKVGVPSLEDSIRASKKYPLSKREDRDRPTILRAWGINR